MSQFWDFILTSNINMRMENRRKGSEMKKTINVKLYNATAQKKVWIQYFWKKTQNDDKCVENMENEIIRKIGWTRKLQIKNGWKKYRKREKQNIVKNKNR